MRDSPKKKSRSRSKSSSTSSPRRKSRSRSRSSASNRYVWWSYYFVPIFMANLYYYTEKSIAVWKQRPNLSEIQWHCIRRNSLNWWSLLRFSYSEPGSNFICLFYLCHYVFLLWWIHMYIITKRYFCNTAITSLILVSKLMTDVILKIIFLMISVLTLLYRHYYMPCY